ncbi:AraC family transcriptional regulator [Nevskia ramosa]|uniref:helix-turn-helix transcriptional regulator n=1 Tax=Nevskia ramosa TaxID=64002 RepID=UPI003D10BF26
MATSARSWNTTATPASVQPGIGYWNELLAEHVMPLDVTSTVSREFSADMAEASFGPCAALMLEARQAQHVDHSRRRVLADSDHDTLMLIHMRAGSIDLSSVAGDVRLACGDAVLLADSDRFVFDASADTRTLVLRIERGWLKRWIPRIDDCSGRRIDGNGGWGGTASSALGNIEPSQIADWHYPATDVAEQLAGLLALAVHKPDKLPSRVQQSTWRRAQMVLRERYADSTLRPADVAAALGISRRYLHQLFAQHGESFSRALYARRLEQAAKLLGRRDTVSLSITEIALACGFSDSSHFSRLFGNRYGLTPSAYRLSGP